MSNNNNHNYNSINQLIVTQIFSNNIEIELNINDLIQFVFQNNNQVSNIKWKTSKFGGPVRRSSCSAAKKSGINILLSILIMVNICASLFCYIMQLSIRNHISKLSNVDFILKISFIDKRQEKSIIEKFINDSFKYVNAKELTKYSTLVKYYKKTKRETARNHDEVLKKNSINFTRNHKTRRAGIVTLKWILPVLNGVTRILMGYEFMNLKAVLSEIRNKMKLMAQSLASNTHQH